MSILLAMMDAGIPDLPTTFFLVRRAKEGEQEALGELLDRYYPRVRKIVRLRLGDKLLGELDATDILQETFIAAIKAFDRFELRNEASVINWLSRIAEREILMASRHSSAEKRGRARRSRAEDTDGRDQLREIADEHRGPVTSVSAQEEAEILEECLAELSEEYREIIILRDYVGHDWEDVARESNRPSAAAARMMHTTALVELNKRVRQRLRE